MGKNWILLKKNNFYFELDHSYFLSCVIAIDVNSSTRELRVPLTLRRLAITVRWISIKVKNLRITRRWSAFHFVYSFLMTLQYGRRNSIQQREWTVYTHKRWIMEWTRRGGGTRWAHLCTTMHNFVLSQFNSANLLMHSCIRCIYSIFVSAPCILNFHALQYYFRSSLGEVGEVFFRRTSTDGRITQRESQLLCICSGASKGSFSG